MRFRAVICIAIVLAYVAAPIAAGEMHDHPVPEKLGHVHFENSCAREVQPAFERAVALLHSFTYSPAREAFASVLEKDPRCAMAHWGIAMSLYHQLWSPPGKSDLQLGTQEIRAAREIGAKTAREREFIDAAGTYFSDDDPTHHAARAKAYENAMAAVVKGFPADKEARIFYALSLLATAPPTDRTHANQKRAVAILEPIHKAHPNHPGVVHYLIHAYDSSELAPRGLAVAREYSKIAPSAPHALHMPSHIYTRLGLWVDSIASNEAARKAARAMGDVGEELHAMDYQAYAYLQLGKDADAERVVGELKSMGPAQAKDFKIGYAATAMPVRLAMERQRWSDAIGLTALPESPPHVAALAYWARAIGQSRSGHPELSDPEIQQLVACADRSHASGDAYWSAQIDVLLHEVRAWQAFAQGHADNAIGMLRGAADAEDALEKLPVTPGPVIPAREQLGEMQLLLHHPQDALQSLNAALDAAPRRRAALKLGLQAAEQVGDSAAASRFRTQLSD
jgi:hypothetical protein